MNYIIVGNSICTIEGSLLAGNKSEEGLLNGDLYESRFNKPSSLALSSNKKHLFVCDRGNNFIRLINIETKQVSTFAGVVKQYGCRNGDKEQALFNNPSSLAFDHLKNRLLICDYYNCCIRAIDIETGLVTTFTGKTGVNGCLDGPLSRALFDSPSDISINNNGIFITDTGNNCIRHINNYNMVSSLTGQFNYGSESLFIKPFACDFCPFGEKFFICDNTDNLKIISNNGEIITQFCLSRYVNSEISFNNASNIKVHQKSLFINLLLSRTKVLLHFSLEDEHPILQDIIY
jgi:DNA-binding beta-propeller fold protein YncE